jgi:hypothetical protein
MDTASSAPGMISSTPITNVAVGPNFTSLFVGFCSAMSVTISLSPCIVDSTSACYMHIAPGLDNSLSNSRSVALRLGA